MRRGLLLAVAFACLAGALALPGHGSAAAGQPVPSLEPRETAELLAKLRDRQVFRTYRVAEDCRPLRAVFYAASDWVRLATRLAANASPCAQYYVSVPPVVGQKTRARPGQAVKIRTLGPQFHALAEIHLTTWQKWVASTGSTWYQAGVEARRSMVAGGFDVEAGDTWAVNELTSAIRRGDGAKRAEIRDFLRGLYDAGGEGPTAKGVVWVVGIGQRVSEVGTYKARLQEWLQDTAFWTDMNAYVSDWSQEVYGDVRGYAAPGADAATRRDALVDYLRHSDLLASAGATASGTANAFFASTSSPVANAAWQWSSAFGWTDVSVELMQQYVSAQVYALRNHSVRTGQQVDHWGFAWAPRNATQQAFDVFQEDTGVVLERMAAAIRDSQTVVPDDPGVNACADGRYCVGDLEGASVVTRWRAFRTWSPTTLGFATPPQTVGAGVVSGPIGLQVQVARVAARPLAPVVATIASSSPTGTFATTRRRPVCPDRERRAPRRDVLDGPALLPGHDRRDRDADCLRRRRRHGDAAVHRLRRATRLAAGRTADVDRPRGRRRHLAGRRRRPVRQFEPRRGRLDDRAAVPRHRVTRVGADRKLRRVQRARLGRRHGNAHDAGGLADGYRVARRPSAALRPRLGDPLRHLPWAAPRLHDGRRHARRPRAERVRHRRALAKRESGRPHRRPHDRRPDDVLAGAVAGCVSRACHARRRTGVLLERVDPRQRVPGAQALTS